MPVCAAPLALIDQFDHQLAAQIILRPQTMSERDTRIRLVETVRRARTAVTMQLNELEQWENALRMDFPH